MLPEYNKVQLDRLRIAVQHDLQREETVFDKATSGIRRLHLTAALSSSFQALFPDIEQRVLGNVVTIAADHIRETTKTRRSGSKNDVDTIVRQKHWDSIWTGVYNDMHLPDHNAIADVSADVEADFEDNVYTAFTVAKALEGKTAPDWQQVVEDIQAPLRRLASRE